MDEGPLVCENCGVSLCHDEDYTGLCEPCAIEQAMEETSKTEGLS